MDFQFGSGLLEVTYRTRLRWGIVLRHTKHVLTNELMFTIFK